MLNSELQLKLKEQKILPILNTTTLSNDIDRLSKYLEKNRAIQYIEVTLRENKSFDIALELKKHFTEHKFGLGSVLTKEDFIKGQDHNFHFFVSPGIVDEILEINNLSYIPGAETVSEFIHLNKKGYKIIKFFSSKFKWRAKKITIN